MNEDEQFRFLTPWTMLLPLEGRPVLAVAGSGGKTALLLRLYRHYRGEGMSVLWTQTVSHFPPEGLEAAAVSRPVSELRQLLREKAALFVAASPVSEEEWGGLEAGAIEELRRQLQPDVVLVEAQEPSSDLIRRDRRSPNWPRPMHLAFVVAGLHGVGRLWSGEEHGVAKEDSRVRSGDVLDLFVGDGGLLEQLPEGTAVLPFLAGLADFRDMDGMFEMVARLWDDPRIKVVLMGELVGPRRIDAAEEKAAEALPGGAPHLEGERIYALYPARLDESV